uniref:Protein kinase domain-containing protein n=1 Tax=Steinernema glaseri TaxID=37863 RepID=A0A1I8A8A0_9BILA
MPAPNRRRRKALEATILVDTTFARQSSPHKKINFEETFLNRTRIPQKGRKKKDPFDDELFRRVCAVEQARLEEQRRQIEQLKSAQAFAFCIENASTYENELHAEAKKLCKEREKERRQRKELKKMPKPDVFEKVQSWVDSTVPSAATSFLADSTLKDAANAGNRTVEPEITDFTIIESEANVTRRSKRRTTRARGTSISSSIKENNAGERRLSSPHKRRSSVDPEEDLFNSTAKRQEKDVGSPAPPSPLSIKDISNTSSTGLSTLISKQTLETHAEDDEQQIISSERDLEQPETNGAQDISRIPKGSSDDSVAEEKQPTRRSARIATKRSIQPTIEFDPVMPSARPSMAKSESASTIGSPSGRSRLSDIERNWQSPSVERMPRVSASKNAENVANCFYLENYVGSESPLGELLHVCGQSELIEFEEIDKKWKVKSKLGEGVYGEVYLVCWEGKRDLAVKVIPFHGDDSQPSTIRFNGELLKSARSMLPEVVMTRELSSLRDGDEDMTDGFVELQNAAVVKTLKEAASIFTQVAFSLMVAEHALEFEHRDLHVGNVLVSREHVPEVISYKYEGNEYHFASHGVKATIIDFTNSRMRKGKTAP